MSNQHSTIYQQVTGKADRAKLIDDLSAANQSSEPPVQDVARAQLRISWLQSTITKEMFTDIAREIQDLEDQAMTLTLSAHQLTPGIDKHLQLLLIQHTIAILRQLVNKYGQS